MSISGTGVVRAPRKNVIFKPVEELTKKPVVQEYIPDGPLNLQKDLTDNASEYERGYQVGYNHALELANQELAARRRLKRTVQPEVLELKDRYLR